MNEKEAYLLLHKASGIKVGDKVKVLRKADNYEMGWQMPWDVKMDEFIGKECIVTIDYDSDGFFIKGSMFPFFCLELVDKKYNESLPESIKNALNIKYTRNYSC